MRRRVFKLLAIFFLGLAALLATGWIASVDKSVNFLLYQLDRVQLGGDTSTHRQSVFGFAFVAGRVEWIWSPETINGIIDRCDRTFSVSRLPLTFFPKERTIPVWPPLMLAICFAVASNFLAGRMPTSRPRFRPRRRIVAMLLPTAACGVTLAAFVATYFCFRSATYFQRLDLHILPGPAAFQLISHEGSLLIAWTEIGTSKTLGKSDLAFTQWIMPWSPQPLLQIAGLKGDYFRHFGFVIGTDGTTPLFRNVIILPYWFVLIATAWLSWRLIRASVRAGRIERAAGGGLCANCGYDLRESGERCPECGRVVKSELTASADRLS